MDLLAEKWLSEIEMDDSVLIGDQWQIELCNDVSVPKGHSNESLIANDHTEQVIEKNNNHFSSVQKFISQNASNSSPYSADENIISFGGSSNYNPPAPPPTSTRKVVRPRQKDCRSTADQSSSQLDVKRGGSRTPLQAQEHVLAERKRRETLSQRFITLEAMIPGLKRSGKASLIEGTINYLKELEERIKILEEEKKRKNHEESVDSTKRPRIASNDGASSSQSNENSKGSRDQSSADIEVRTSDRDVVFRVCCKKRTGITVISDCASLNLKCSCR